MTIRMATADDVTVLVPLMDAAIEVLQKGFLDDDQIESSKAIMGIDRQLIDDGTYFVVEIDGAVAGCGGWSRRATLYGGDHSAGRNAALLDPATEPARIRAMYTHPLYARRGVGRLIIETCEAAAAAEGFATIELMATRSWRPLYEAAGFQPMGGSRMTRAELRSRSRACSRSYRSRIHDRVVEGNRIGARGRPASVPTGARNARRQRTRRDVTTVGRVQRPAGRVRVRRLGHRKSTSPSSLSSPAFRAFALRPRAVVPYGEMAIVR